MKKVIITKIPNEFKEGIRLLMLTQRSKEGGKVSKPDRIAIKRISRNKEEFDKYFNELLEIMKKDDRELRIYSSVNPRNIDKAIREFKYRQLEADYYDTESRYGFYYDIKNRWISSLMKPSSKADSNFLIDIDDMSQEEYVYDILSKNNIEILLKYNTKNGVHYITKPFNHTLFPKFKELIHVDGIMLLAYSK